jgi:hypothetical protein
MDFLPEWKPDVCGDIIRAVYRFNDKSPWHYVLKGKSPAIYQSLYDANEAAKAICNTLNNSKIRSTLPDGDPAPDMFGIEEWKKRKARGGPSAATVFAPGKKPFKVEIKDRKWRRAK